MYYVCWVKVQSTEVAHMTVISSWKHNLSVVYLAISFFLPHFTLISLWRFDLGKAIVLNSTLPECKFGGALFFLLEKSKRPN